MKPVWAGIDVGGRRKGFHVAFIDDRAVIEVLQLREAKSAAESVASRAVELAAVDSPRSPAPQGETARQGERDLVRAKVCNIRWTPDRERLSANPTYYEWIEHGFELYEALDEAGVAVIECFPTASWSRWAGPRGTAPRSVWSTRALAGSGLTLPTRRPSQDERDAIGAALTARAHTRGETESFGDIVVPATRVRAKAPLRKNLSEIAAEVAEEMAAAGRPHSVPPDVDVGADDPGFWDEVERRYNEQEQI